MKKTSLLSVALGALLLVGCGGDKPAEPSAPAETVIRIATESSFKPFSYLDNQGNTVGFEIDLANALCDEMKVKCQIDSQEWDSLIPSLQADKADAIMAGMSVTPERQAVVDFTDSYFDNKLVIIGKKGEIVTLDTLAGKTVGVQQATLSADYLAKHQPNATVKPYDKQDNVYLDLTAGRIDYMMSDIAPVADWLTTDAGKNFEIKGEPIDVGDKIAIAVGKGDELRAKLNTALATLKTNGKYDELSAKHFTHIGTTSSVAPTEPASESASEPAPSN